MPKTPVFDFHGKLPFELSWHAGSSVWKLVVTEGFDISGLGLLEVQENEFVLSSSRLKATCEYLQGRLKELELRNTEFIPGLEMYSIVKWDDRNITFSGPNLPFICNLHGIKLYASSRSLKLGGTGAFKRYEILKEYLTKMTKNLAKPVFKTDGLARSGIDDSFPAHTSWTGYMVDSVAAGLKERGIPFILLEKGRTVCIANWHTSVIADLAMECRDKLKVRQEALLSLLNTDYIKRKIPEWAKVSAEIYGLKLMYPKSMIQKEPTTVMRRCGLIGYIIPEVTFSSQTDFTRLMPYGRPEEDMIEDLLHALSAIGAKMAAEIRQPHKLCV